MKIKDSIKNCLDYFIKIKLSLKLIKLNVELQSGVKVDNKTTFEGDSVIYKNTSIKDSQIGKGSYVGWDSIMDKCRIGKFCSIAPYTEVIYGRHPTNEFCSTHPAFFSIQKQAGFTFVDKSCFPEFKYADDENEKSVVIGNDVWIGQGAKILEGVTIGDGAIIGANAFVTKNIEPYSINVGVPTKKIKYRFTDETIRDLEKSEWWNQDFKWLKKNIDAFNDPAELIRRLIDGE